MAFDYLKRQQLKEEKRERDYEYWHQTSNTDGRFMEPILVYSTERTRIKRKIDRLQKELKITTYPKRLKKIRKNLEKLMDEHPEDFI
jgi:hypothetical protein